MAQHIDSLSSKGPLKEVFLSTERKKSIRIAKERKNFDVDNWEQLKWYVKFSQLDFGQLSDGDLLKIQDKVAALCWVVEGRIGGRPLLPSKYLMALHQKFSTHLANWADKFSTNFGTFSITIVGHRPKKILEKHPDSNPENLKNVSEVNVSKTFSN